MTKRSKLIIGIGAAIGAIYLYRSKLSGGGPVPSVTTSVGFDLTPYGGPTVYPEPIKRTAQAIAHAEGFGIDGAIPTLANNPGDLVAGPDWTGPTLGANIKVFDSVDAGWNALYKQLWIALTGESNYYYPDMTIADMSKLWTATQPDNWAANVASYLGVPTSTPIYAVLA